MKARLLLSFLFSFSFFLLSSQTPQGFNYQAIARDASGNPILNTNLQVKIAVMADSLGSAVYWEELFNPVQTNNYGLFTVVMGRGSRLATSTVAAFANIDWKVTPVFVRTQIYYPNAWKNMGSTRLWSVPYALSANDVIGTLSKLKVTGTTQYMDSALFEVKNNTGQTVFAVYNEGVRIYVDNGMAKGATKGGFAIGGFGTGKGISQPLFIVDPDSIRAYIDTSKVKSVKGGFAIGGFSKAKGLLPNFMEMTPKNYFIGEGSGSNNSSGRYNSFLGFQAGLNNSTGNNNAFFGYMSGFSNTTGASNLFLGYQSGYSNQAGSFNTFMGFQAGYDNLGTSNTFLGSYSGTNNTSGSNNSFVGFKSGFTNSTGNENNFVGDNAGYSNSTGSSNVFIGPKSGYNNIAGDSNLFIGVKTGLSYKTGKNNIFLGANGGWQIQNGNNNILVGVQTAPFYTSTNDNIFIGYRAGYFYNQYGATIGDGNIWIGKNAGWNIPNLWQDQFNPPTFPQRPLENTLVIDQNDASYSTWGYYPQHYPAGDLNRYPLIFGNFSFETGRRCVVINGIYSYTYTFFVNGAAGGKTSWASVSDARLKRNIESIPDALNKIARLRGVNFEWTDTLNSEKGRQMGFIAQEAEKVVPEVVRSNGGTYSMYYAPITALLVEGMKEQQKIIESQRREIEDQKSRIESLSARLDQIEAALGKSGIKRP